MDLTILPRSWTPSVQALLRMMIGLLFLQHGLAKLIDFPHMENIKSTFAVFGQMSDDFRIAAGLIGNCWRRVAHDRIAHSSGGVYLVRLLRGRLFHGPCTNKLLSRAERRRAFGALLLCLAVPCGGGSGSLGDRQVPRRIGVA